MAKSDVPEDVVLKEHGTHDQLGRAVVAAIAHDLGSPMAALGANVSMAREMIEALPEPLRTELGELLEDIGTSGVRLGAVLDDIRGYALSSDESIYAVHELVARAQRLTRSWVTRRTQLEVSVDAGVTARGAPTAVVRAISQIMVGLTQDLPLERGDRKLVVRLVDRTLEMRIAPRGPIDELSRRVLERCGHMAGISDTRVEHDGRGLVATLPLGAAS